MRISGVDIGRVADHQVESAAQWFGPRTAMKPDVAEAEPHGICTCDAERGDADVGGVDFALWPFRGNGEGNGAAARAEIGDTPVGLRRDFCERGLDQKFRVRARDENGRRDF